MKNCFTFTRRWWEQIQQLSDSDQLLLYRYIADYAFGRKETITLSTSEGNKVFAHILHDFQQRERRNGTYVNEETEKAPLKEEKEKNPHTPIKEKEESNPEKDAEERAFAEQLRYKYPQVAAMNIPLTLEQYQKLLHKWPNSLIKSVLLQMNHYRNIGKYTTAYLTLIKWMQLEKNRLEGAGLWDPYEKELAEQRKIIQLTVNS